MIVRAPIPTIDEIRAELARKEAELAQRRAARLLSARTASATVAAEHARRRTAMECLLADAVARVATTTARCEMRIQDRLTYAAR